MRAPPGGSFNVSPTGRSMRTSAVSKEDRSWMKAGRSFWSATALPHERVKRSLADWIATTSREAAASAVCRARAEALPCPSNVLSRATSLLDAV
jgi:hypothetical protein